MLLHGVHLSSRHPIYVGIVELGELIVDDRGEDAEEGSKNHVLPVAKGVLVTTYALFFHSLTTLEAWLRARYSRGCQVEEFKAVMDHDVLEGSVLKLKCRGVSRLASNMDGKHGSRLEVHDLGSDHDTCFVLHKSVVGHSIRDVLVASALAQVELNGLVGAQGELEVATSSWNSIVHPAAGLDSFLDGIILDLGYVNHTRRAVSAIETSFTLAFSVAVAVSIAIAVVHVIAHVRGNASTLTIALSLTGKVALVEIVHNEFHGYVGFERGYHMASLGHHNRREISMVAVPAANMCGARELVVILVDLTRLEVENFASIEVYALDPLEGRADTIFLVETTNTNKDLKAPSE